MTMSFESMLPILGKDVFGDAEGPSANFLMMGVGAGALSRSVFSIAAIRSERRTRHDVLLITSVLSGASHARASLFDQHHSSPCSEPRPWVASQAAFMAISGAMIQTLSHQTACAEESPELAHINIGGTMALVNLTNGYFADDAFGAQNVLCGVMGSGVRCGRCRRV